MDGDVGQASFDFQAGYPGAHKIWHVGALVTQLRERIERDFFDVWVEGEISNFHQAASRHCYFTLKDGQAQLKAALFSAQARYLKFKPRDGMQVLVRGRVSVYEARGELQCCVEHMEPLGRGALQLAFEQLKEKLAQEGLFAAERKRALPQLPRRIGVVSSARGAAVRDIMHTLRRRFPGLDILLYPVAVQGDAAAGEICRALEYFAAAHAGEGPATHRVDTLIVARGGGSIEDLWPFNEERVARMLARMPMPVISGVGHETDFTIADFVADVRAPTPTAAAELAVRPREEFMRQLTAAERHLLQGLRVRLLRRRQAVEVLSRRRAFRAVEERLRQRAQTVDELTFRLRMAVQRRVQERRQRLTLAAARVRHHDVRTELKMLTAGLEARQRVLLNGWRAQAAQRRSRLAALAALLEERNPLRILQRGYALVYGEGGVLATDPAAVRSGEALRIRLAEGWLDAQARKTGDKNGS